jgi:hypothetical protein
MGRNVPTSHLTTAATLLVLRKCRDKKNRQHCNKSDRFFHNTPSNQNASNWPSIGASRKCVLCGLQLASFHTVPGCHCKHFSQHLRQARTFIEGYDWIQFPEEVIAIRDLLVPSACVPLIQVIQ